MGRTEPRIIITCDRCGEQDHIGLRELSSGSWSTMDVEFLLKGQCWTREAGRDLCPDCRAHPKAKGGQQCQTGT